MKLLTKKIVEQATGQYSEGSDFDKQKVVAKFFNPCGLGTWYLMNMDKDEDYCWGIVNLHAVESGSFSIKELEDLSLPFGLTIERDISFKPMPALEVWDRLNNGDHI